MKMLLVFALFFSQLNLVAQTIPVRVEQKVKDRVNRKIDEGIDKGLNKTEDEINKGVKKKDTKKKSSDNTKTSGTTKTTKGGKQTVNADSTKPGGGKPFSDFVPGTKIIFQENFEKDALNDFPAGWNTTGSGAVVNLDGQNGKWLNIAHNTVVHPVLQKPLPENCTIEFDLFLQSNGDGHTPIVQYGLTPVKNVLREDLFYRDKFFMTVSRYNERDGHSVEYGLKEVIGNKNDFPILSYANKILHVSMAINKTRIRVYFDKTKIVDLPMALTAEMRNNFYLCNTYVIPASESGMFVSNIRIASGDVDARSLLVKDLLEKGRASTNEILFDVNKDLIKKESFAIINQIGEALKANPTLKIKIVGHTDSDGNAADNLSLSKRRAEAVSSYLINNFGIDDSRITTDGKGATVPVADNKTADGKAKNRRVEFIKQ